MRNLPFIIGALLVTMTLGGCAAGARVTVRERPHRPPYYVPGPPAHPGWIWIGGEWVWQRGRYVYTKGYWTPPRRGYAWAPGHWKRMGNGWHWEPGRWRRA